METLTARPPWHNQKQEPHFPHFNTPRAHARVDTGFWRSMVGVMHESLESFTGGVLDTNAFLFQAPKGTILFDAPQGSDRALAERKLDLLVLTHGHFDHVADAAAIIRRHQCPVFMHPLTVQMVKEQDFFKRWGFMLEVEPVEPDALIDEGKHTWLDEPVEVFHIPGHCPGSLCVLIPSIGTVIGGDVLFRGGIGRTDLPGGDHEQLISGIQKKLLPLPDDTVVLPGHGPETTIGRERKSNPYIQ
jgi:glyoxylase-like metal-dependent hydrolase (beta-lactamase superfamily II)